METGLSLLRELVKAKQPLPCSLLKQAWRESISLDGEELADFRCLLSMLSRDYVQSSGDFWRLPSMNKILSI